MKNKNSAYMIFFPYKHNIMILKYFLKRGQHQKCSNLIEKYDGSLIFNLR